MALTARGRKTQATLTRELYRPPAELLALERRDLEALLVAVQKLKAEPESPAHRG